MVWKDASFLIGSFLLFLGQGNSITGEAGREEEKEGKEDKGKISLLDKLQRYQPQGKNVLISMSS